MRFRTAQDYIDWGLYSVKQVPEYLRSKKITDVEALCLKNEDVRTLIGLDILSFEQALGMSLSHGIALKETPHLIRRLQTGELAVTDFLAATPDYDDRFGIFESDSEVTPLPIFAGPFADRAIKPLDSTAIAGGDFDAVETWEDVFQGLAPVDPSPTQDWY